MTSAAKGGVARGRPDPNLQISPQSLKWELLPINPVPRSIVNNRSESSEYNPSRLYQIF